MAASGSAAVRDAPSQKGLGYLKNQIIDENLELEIAELEKLYEKKLWHQLTLKLQSVTQNPFFQSEQRLVDLYKNFTYDFETKINPLALVQMLSFVAKQIPSSEEAIQFLEKNEAKVKAHSEAVLLLKVLRGQILLHKNGDLVATKTLLEDSEKALNDLEGVTDVHGRFYKLYSDFYRIKANHAEYYRSALRYLGCINLDTLGDEEKVQQACYLGLAALLGEGVYNFGELLAHPILEALRKTSNKWIVDLLFVFNSGSLKQFEELRSSWSQQPDLVANELFLRQKICLLALMEMTFRRPANNRQLLFQEICQETSLPLEEVELLVMKALSLNLVKGYIDQVEQKVYMTWVQPRVLDKKQVSVMINRLDTWCRDIQAMEMLVEKKAHDILTF
ncbi:unnamed protein product [Darwinula stevensoni]|uniref:26S proteasome non-ATPase regulatory subunit 13 n=1 Tax=Darwinula stevensoni TaxID=69355 RepID=A0A7R9A9K1_9CRUS|nr:unnamed protein product [Darwinula stevensoni]CAG0897372.1 unnamed protein product [Darwinula stevensoni]